MEPFQLYKDQEERDMKLRAADRHQDTMEVRRDAIKMAQANMASDRVGRRPSLELDRFIASHKAKYGNDTYEMSRYLRPSIDVSNFAASYAESRQRNLKAIERYRRERNSAQRRLYTTQQQIAMDDTEPYEPTAITAGNIRQAWSTNDYIRKLTASKSEGRLDLHIWFENIVMREAEKPEDYPEVPLYPFTIAMSIARNGHIDWDSTEGHKHEGYVSNTIHPHWLHDGPCLGTFKEPFRSAIKQGHVDVALSILTAFLSQYTILDAAGAKVYRWVPNHPNYGGCTPSQAPGHILWTRAMGDANDTNFLEIGDPYELEEMTSLLAELEQDLRELDPGKLVEEEDEERCEECSETMEECECINCDVCDGRFFRDDMYHYDNTALHPNTNRQTVHVACQGCHEHHYYHCDECEHSFLSHEFNCGTDMCHSCHDEQEESSDD